MHLAHARNEERQMPRVLGCTGLRSLPLISAIMYVCASPRRMHHNFWYLRPISPGSTVLWDRTWGWGEQCNGAKYTVSQKKLTDFIKNDKLNKLKPFLMNSVSYFFGTPSTKFVHLPWRLTPQDVCNEIGHRRWVDIHVFIVKWAVNTYHILCTKKIPQLRAAMWGGGVIWGKDVHADISVEEDIMADI